MFKLKSNLLPLFCFVLANFYLISINGQESAKGFTAADFYERGLSLHDQEDYDGAIECYSITLEMDKSCTKCLYNRGQAFLSQDKFRKALMDFNQLLKLDPADIEAYEQRGQLNFTLNNYATAAEDFSMVINTNPSAEMHVNRGLCYLTEKRYKDAISDLKNALIFAPNDLEALRTLGDAYFALNEMQSAIVYYNRALAIAPNDINTLNNRGNTFQILGDDEAALNDYSMAIAAYPNSYTYSNRANFWLKKEDFNKALIDAKKASKLDYKNADAYYCIGMVENANGNPIGAILNFDKAIEFDQSKSEFFNGRGLAYFQEGAYEDAQFDFEQAVKLNPADAAAKDRINDCYQKINQTNKISEFTIESPTKIETKALPQETLKTKGVPSEFTEKGVSDQFLTEGNDGEYLSFEMTTREKQVQKTIVEPKAEPSLRKLSRPTLDDIPAPTEIAQPSVEMQLNLADFNFKAKNYESAIEGYTKSLKQNSYLAKAYNNRSICYMNLGDFAMAQKDLDSYIRLNPTNAFAFNDRGTLKYKAGDIFGAKKDYDLGLEIEPANKVLLLNRAKWFIQMDQYKKAAKDLTTAIENNVNDSELYYQRSLILFEQKDYDNAISDLELAIKISAIERDQYFFQKGKVLFYKGRLSDALVNLNRAIDLSPRYAEAYLYRGTLKSELNDTEGACMDITMAKSLGFKGISKLGFSGDCLD